MKPSTRTPNSQLYSAVNRHVQEEHHSHHQHPTSVPPEPTPKHSSFSATFRSVFNRHPSRAPSGNSLHSSYSAASSARPQPQSSQANEYRPLHPYAAMVAAPLPVVSSHDATENEDDCPVCLEPLSFSFRLPGEKPHIVPECGHALHEVSVVFGLFFLFPPIPLRPRRSLLKTSAIPHPAAALVPVLIEAVIERYSSGNSTWRTTSVTARQRTQLSRQRRPFLWHGRSVCQ